MYNYENNSDRNGNKYVRVSELANNRVNVNQPPPPPPPPPTFELTHQIKFLLRLFDGCSKFELIPYKHDKRSQGPISKWSLRQDLLLKLRNLELESLTCLSLSSKSCLKLHLETGPRSYGLTSQGGLENRTLLLPLLPLPLLPLPFPPPAAPPLLLFLPSSPPPPPPPRPAAVAALLLLLLLLLYSHRRQRGNRMLSCV